MKRLISGIALVVGSMSACVAISDGWKAGLQILCFLIVLGIGLFLFFRGCYYRGD